MIKRIKTLMNSCIGNILDWYDLGLFAIYSSVFSELFFPHTSQSHALFETFSVFAIGYLCRPIGALIFGYFGDRQGRAKTLRLSILMICLPTFIIGFLPTYSEIGLLAPVLLTLIRIWQGISIGGEYSGNLIYLAETAPQKHRALITSFGSTGANLGILLATLTGTFCTWFFTEETFREWAWRIPFLSSGIISLFIYYTRINLQETPVFEYLEKNNLIQKNPIQTLFQKNVFHLFRTMGLVCLGSTYYYFCFIYLPVFFSKNLGLSLSKISVIMTMAFFIMLFLVPLSGLLCDYLGRRKMLIFNALAVLILLVPAFILMKEGNVLSVCFMMLILTILSSLEQATTSIAVVENFPVAARYSGLSFAYNLGNGILGGTVPVFSVYLSQAFHSDLAPAIYVSVCAGITGLVAYFFVPETKATTLLT